MAKGRGIARYRARRWDSCLPFTFNRPYLVRWGGRNPEGGNFWTRVPRRPLMVNQEARLTGELLLRGITEGV